MNFISKGRQFPVYSREHILSLEQRAINQYHINSFELMQRAGKAAFVFLRKYYPKATQILIIAGGGNNAGDGYILAKLLHQAGVGCCVMPVVPITQLRGDAMRAQNEYAIIDGLDVHPSEHLPPCDLIVDALFGTGLTRPIEGQFARIVKTINQAEVPVLAIDIPSGLNCETGNTSGPAIEADATITFIGLKSGLITGEAKIYTGEVVLDALNLPDELFDESDKLGLAHGNDLVKHLLPPRCHTDYKNKFGHVLIIGGNVGYPNAARLAAEAAARTGAGLVSVATHPDSVTTVASGCASLMVKAIHCAGDLSELLNKADVIAMGPGLGQDKWAQSIFARVIESRQPMVIDADALHLLSRNPGQSDHWILTPHPGEAAQLLACSPHDIQLNRLSAALAIQEQYGGIAVLKGSGTLVCHPGGTDFCIRGNACLATGGTGDVLTGIIAALLAQQLNLVDAANVGTLVHGMAGEHISREGTRGLLAQDLFPAIYQLVNQA